MNSNEWKLSTLGRLGTIVMGQAPSSNYVSDRQTKGAWPFLQGNAEFGDVHPTGKLWCTRPAKTCKAGDSLISVRAPVGALNIADLDYCVGRGLSAVRFTGLEPKFGNYQLTLKAQRLHRVAQGSTFDAVGSKELKNLEFLVPSRGEQQRIACVLEALDNQIQGTEQIMSKLRLAGHGLLSDLMTGRVSRERREHRAGLGQLPASWTVARCDELCREIVVGIVIRPSQYYRAAGIPMLRSANVRTSGLVLEELKYMSASDHAKMKKSSVGPGDLVTVRTGYPGTTAVVPHDLKEANCIDITISRPGPRIVAEYLAIWINSEYGKGQVLRAQGGLAQQHFNVSEMKSLLVAVPPLSAQRRIVEIWTEHNARINAEVSLAHSLRQMRIGLMLDLLTGRVPMPAEVAA
jgi:type I restriction enzyme, S subunit